MNKIRTMTVVLSVALLTVASTASQAQEGGNFQEFYPYVGQDPGMGPKCPPMQYHVIAKNKTRLEGVAYAYGEDGMELYSVTGALASDGKVSMDLKPATGAGKPAVVQGTYKSGMLMLKTVSGSCHVDEFMMMPMVPPVRTTVSGGR